MAAGGDAGAAQCGRPGWHVGWILSGGRRIPERVGTCACHLAHGGGEYDTQHGLTNAIILPVVLRFNLPGMEDKVLRMAQAIGLKDTSTDAFIAEIERILDALDIPKSLSEIGVPGNCAARIAEKALQDAAASTNPRPADLAEMQNLVEQAIVRAR